MFVTPFITTPMEEFQHPLQHCCIVGAPPCFTIPSSMVTQFKILMVENYIPPYQWHLKLKITNEIKITRDVAYVGLMLPNVQHSQYKEGQLWHHVSLYDFTIITIHKALKVFLNFVLVIWLIVQIELYTT